jgi:tRNA modification GTPase
LISTDTIVAISTPLGEGGIGIVRLSGPDAFAAVNKIFVCDKSNQADYPRSRYLYYGTIKNLNNEPIDEALVAFMHAPNTYTREDVAEINCHSGIATLRAILGIILELGIRLAEPGEFTKRAFLNGRIDLSQAESVIGLIRARSEEAVKSSLRTMRGELSCSVKLAREKIIAAQAPIEAAIDYPEEYDESAYDNHRSLQRLKEIQALLRELLKGIKKSRAHYDGVAVTIIGKPNVGKSSLLNRLLGQQKAIVHEMPGTTRDLLEGQVIFGGYPLRLIDTAGIQGTMDPVEKEGINRARSAAAEAKLILHVIDGSESLTLEDSKSIIEPDKGQGLIVVVNKSDLPQMISLKEVKTLFPGVKISKLSALSGEGINDLENVVVGELDYLFGAGQENPLLINVRQEEIIREALISIEQAIDLCGKEPVEIISLKMREAWQKLAEIIGETASDDLLDRVFSEFCLGK